MKKYFASLVVVLASVMLVACDKTPTEPAPVTKTSDNLSETEVANSIGLEEEGLFVHLPTEFEIQENGVWFGPKGSQPGTEDYYLYNFSKVDKNSDSYKLVLKVLEAYAYDPYGLEYQECIDLGVDDQKAKVLMSGLGR